MVVMLGGEEMNKLFQHVGKVLDEDTYISAMDKVEQGIRQLTNQATARFKLFQEMPQDGRVQRVGTAGGRAGQQVRLEPV